MLVGNEIREYTAECKKEATVLFVSYEVSQLIKNCVIIFI